VTGYLAGRMGARTSARAIRMSRLRCTALVSLAAAIAVAAAGATAASARADVFRLTVTNARHGRPLAANFLGLALEFNQIPELAGATPESVDPVFVQLLKNLDPTGRPIIRVGGQSTDRAWWPVPGMSRPIGVTYDLTPAWTAAARSLAQATGSKLLLGINLESNRTRVAQREGAEFLQRIGSQDIDALEIGNEPDLYSQIPWYLDLNGHPMPWYSHAGTPVFSRAPTYGPQDFLAEFERTAKVLPALPLAGPETGTAPWMDAFDRLLSPRSQVRILTSHAYGLNNCVTDPAAPGYPSVPNLVSETASRRPVAGIEPDVALAHRNGARYQIDEMGSISCNGRAGVSNTLASALWVMDSLFTIDADDVDGVNLHSYPNSVNGLFDFARSHGAWQGTVRPLYYGALMFAQAAPAGSRLLRISSGSQSSLRAWATLAPDHRTRVLVINDSLTSSALALIRLPGRSGPAGLERLGARSAYATGGITLGGESFGATTSTGVLPAPVPQDIVPHAGAYGVTLPAGSAALLTLPLTGSPGS
jgi:hypothetical protein